MDSKKLFLASLLLVVILAFTSNALAPESWISRFTYSRSGSFLLVIIVFLIAFVVVKLAKAIRSTRK